MQAWYWDMFEGYLLIFQHNWEIFLIKFIGIRVFIGSGRTWNIIFISLYDISKGLFVSPTEMTAKIACTKHV